MLGTFDACMVSAGKGTGKVTLFMDEQYAWL
jgi:hypothetical protein